MREKFLKSTGALRRQALENVLKIAMRIVSVEFGGLDQAHDCGGTLAGAQRSSEQPVRPTESHGTDPVFDVVVVDR